MSSSRHPLPAFTFQCSRFIQKHHHRLGPWCLSLVQRADKSRLLYGAEAKLVQHKLSASLTAQEWSRGCRWYPCRAWNTVLTFETLMNLRCDAKSNLCTVRLVGGQMSLRIDTDIDWCVVHLSVWVQGVETEKAPCTWTCEDSQGLLLRRQAEACCATGHTYTTCHVRRRRMRLKPKKHASTLHACLHL